MTSARSGGGGVPRSLGSGGFAPDGASAQSNYSVEGTAELDLDIWGRIRRTVESDVAGAQVSAADLANATLSAQATLATDYFELRGQDAADAADRHRRRLPQRLEITQNQYHAGTAARSDVSPRRPVADHPGAADRCRRARAQFEHAIAVLTGHPPADLTLPPASLHRWCPSCRPACLRLLERRPDIAAAERAMEQENALIGVAIAAYYPDISLSRAGRLYRRSARLAVQCVEQLWSLGASAAETLFEAACAPPRCAPPRAAYDESVANYRQTVLTAFQQVEDELSDLRILRAAGRRRGQRRCASASRRCRSR